MRAHRWTIRTSAFLLAGVCFGSGARAQQTATWREWNRPVEPFRIAGPLYYVGMAQVTSLLVTTKEGHILVDGAFSESAARILDNVRVLGLDEKKAGRRAFVDPDGYQASIGRAERAFHEQLDKQRAEAEPAARRE